MSSFCGFNPPKGGLFQSKQGSFGFQLMRRERANEPGSELRSYPQVSRNAHLSTRWWFQTFVEFAPGNLWKNESSILTKMFFRWVAKKTAPNTPFEYRMQLYIYTQTNQPCLHTFYIHIIPIFTSFFPPKTKNPSTKKHLFTHLLQCVPGQIIATSSRRVFYPKPQMMVIVRESPQNPLTPWKFNITPENIPSQKESTLPTIIFQGLC